MLQINLIPVERRRKERTPLPRFIVIIAMVIVCLGILIWDVKTLLDTKSLRHDLDEKKKELTSLQESVKNIPELLAKQLLLVAWEVEADIITNSRPFKWWHAVDIIWDIFAEFPTVWITSFQTSDKGPSGRGREPMEAMMRFDCRSLGASTTTMTDFRRRLKNTPDLLNIFDAGINKDLFFNLVQNTESNAKEEWIVSFLIELYRKKKEKEEEKK